MITAALAILQTDEQRDILSEFYEENKNRFYMLAYSKLHNSEASEDAVQEAFLRIVRYPDRFFSIEPHKRLPYSIIIIKNVVLQMLEKQGKYVLRSCPRISPTAICPLRIYRSVTLPEVNWWNSSKPCQKPKSRRLS